VDALTQTCAIGTVKTGDIEACIAVTNTTANTLSVTDSFGSFTATSLRTIGSGAGGTNGAIEGFYKT